MSLRREPPLTTKRQLVTQRRVSLRTVATQGEEHRVLRRVVQQVQKATKAARQEQHSQGVAVKAKPTAAQTLTALVHNLGYKPTAFRLDRMRTGEVTYRIVDADSRIAKVHFSGAATLDFWMY